MLIIQSSLSSATPKVNATPMAPSAMPSEPAMSSGLRPNFSTVKIATQVKPRLSTPLKTVSFVGLSNPIAS